MRHSNGRPVVRIYGPTTNERRGGTIAFNFSSLDGKLFDCYAAQEEANIWGISLRSGCFCNPGVREIAFSFAREELAACFRQKEQLSTEQFLQSIDGRLKQGALRVSVGLATNFADISHFLKFDGPALVSLRVLVRAHPAALLGSYQATYLCAQAVATWQAMVEAGRPCFLLVVGEVGMPGTAWFSLEHLFLHVGQRLLDMQTERKKKDVHYSSGL